MASFDDADFGTICVCAVRYSLGRQTYMPGLVQDFVRRNMKHIDDNAVYVMHRDISTFSKDRSAYGMSCDYTSWMKFKEYLSDQLEERGVGR